MSVELAGHRVWSLTLQSDTRRRLVPWPAQLAPRLRGTAESRILDAATGELLWNGTVQWSESGSPDLTDHEGRQLAVNKWGLLRPSFEYRDADIRERVAASASEVLALLQDAGFESFIVGGTLLGAVRDGVIMPHDDDADIAYLSDHEHPSDLVLENDRIRRLLEDRGYRVLRHSWAHLQVLAGGTGKVDYYVDVFTAFYRNGQFHEPIHVRAPGLDDAILPLRSIELHGRLFPMPRDPEAWLEACYGPNWRVPDPTFKFETPVNTRRRFDAWFSSYNAGRNAWEDRYAAGLSGHESDWLRPHVLEAARGTRRVIDLGSGSGEDAAVYQAAGLECTPVDYALGSPSVTGGGIALNLVNYLDGIRFLTAQLGASGTGPAPVIAANHLLACQDERGRATLFRLIAFALRSGARVISADYEQLGAYDPQEPRTWHLDEHMLVPESRRAGLTHVVLERATHTDEDGITRGVTVVEFQLFQLENGEN